MQRSMFALAAVLVVGRCRGQAQPADPAPSVPETKGTYLGVTVAPVPEALYAHLSDLPRDRGVIVTQVIADSPAARADLRRHDVLLTYDDRPIKDAEHFTRLIRADKPQHRVHLTLLRGGRERTAEAMLALGPVLPDLVKKTEEKEPVKHFRTGAANKVNVAVTPLDEKQLAVTIEYFDEGKLQEIKCSGTAAEIAKRVQELPPRVQDLTRAALLRVRVLEPQKAGVK
jgi:hypothetical protein